MRKKLTSIMLVDDNQHDNFFHKRAIQENDPENVVVTKSSGVEALEYLTSRADPRCNLILLDINMPGMNGWEFLKKYDTLDAELKGQTVIIMLTTSDNPGDIAKAGTYTCVSDYITKPLTKEAMREITEKYFK